MSDIEFIYYLIKKSKYYYSEADSTCFLIAFGLKIMIDNIIFDITIVKMYTGKTIE